MTLLEQVVQNPYVEPQFTSDAESWAVYVGPVLPYEILDEHHNGDVKAAVAEYLQPENWPWGDEVVPSWLKASLVRYAQENMSLDN